MHAHIINGSLVISNISTNNILVATDSPIIRTKLESHFKQFIPIITEESLKIKYFNYYIIQSN